MSTGVNAFLDIVRKSHATQQLINQVLHQGTPVSMVCPTCNRRTEHRDLKLDGIFYTVCCTCHSMTTTTER